MAIISNTVLNEGLQLVKGTVDSAKELIRKETDKAKPALRSQTMVRYHARNDRAELMKGMTLGSLLSTSSYTYYMVDTYPTLTTAYLYRYYKQGMPELKLEITYRINAAAGKETTMVELLAKRQTPEKELHNWLVNRTTDAFTGLEQLALDNLVEFKNKLEKSLQAKAATDGLKVSITIDYKYEPLPIDQKIPVNVPAVKVQPQGYVHFVNLAFDAVLKPDPAAAGSAYVHIGYQHRHLLKPFLTGLLEEYIRKEVSYNQLTEHLQGNVRQGLLTWWNNALHAQNKGWQVRELQFSFTDKLPEIFKLEQLTINIVLNKAQVTLTNAVIMNLQNGELYMLSGITDLAQWVRDKLQQTTQNILARYSYAELISRFTELTSMIQNGLNGEANKIGYEVKYLMMSDLIDSSKLKFSFSLAVDEQEFGTALNDMIKLNIHVSGRIKSLDHETWRLVLKPDVTQDFGKEMKAEVLRYLRQTLLRIDPADFYTAFNTTVSESLIKDIRTILTNQFNVHENVDIVPTIEETEIGKLLRDLKNGFYTTQVNLFRNNAGYVIKYSVSGIGLYKWGLFASRNFTSKEIVVKNLSSQVAAFIKHRIETNVTQINMLQHPRFIDLIRRLAEYAIQPVCEATGIMIEVINVMSAYNNVTDEWVEDNIKKSRETLLALSTRIQETEKKILALIGIDPGEVKKLEDIKKDLEERMKKEKFTANDLSISHDEDINKLIGRITEQLRLEGPGTKPNDQAPNDDDDDDDNAIPV